MPRTNTETAKTLFHPFAERKKDLRVQLGHVSIAPIRSATSAPSVAESVMDDPGGIQAVSSFQLSEVSAFTMMKIRDELQKTGVNSKAEI